MLHNRDITPPKISPGSPAVNSVPLPYMKIYLSPHRLIWDNDIITPPLKVSLPPGLHGRPAPDAVFRIWFVLKNFSKKPIILSTKSL